MKEKITPTVGMGASTGFNGDRYPYTVVAVNSPKSIEVTGDSYKVTEEDSYLKEGSLECDFTTNWDGHRTTLTLRKNGRWVPKGQGMNEGWPYSVGNRSYSRNPHF